MKLFKSAGIYLGANLLNGLTPFLLLPFLTRILSPDDFALVVMFSLLVKVFVALVGFSVQGSVTVYYFKMQASEFSNYISSCMLLVVAGSVFSIVLVLASGSVFERITGVPERWVLIAVSVAGLQVLSLFMLFIWQAEGSPLKYGLVQIARTVAEGGLVLLFIGVFATGWVGKGWATLLVSACFGVFALTYLMGAGYLKVPDKPTRYIQLGLSFGIPLIPYVLGSMISVTFDRFVIVSLVSIEKAGIYMAGYQLAQLIQLGTQSFNKAFAPWLLKQLASGPSAEKKSRLVVASYFCMFVYLVGALIFGYLAPWFASHFLGDGFSDAGDVVLMLGLGFAFRGGFYLLVNYVFFVEKTKFLGFLSIAAGVLGLPVTYFAVNRYGLNGAAFGFAFIQLITFIIVWAYSSRVYKMPWFGILSSKSRKM